MQLIHPEKINKIVRKPILSHTCYSCMLEFTIIICMSHKLKWNLKKQTKNSSVYHQICTTIYYYTKQIFSQNYLCVYDIIYILYY